MLKWFDMLDIITRLAVRGGSTNHRLVRMSPNLISRSGRSEMYHLPPQFMWELQLLERVNLELWGARWRIKGQRALHKMCMVWSGLAVPDPPMSHVSAAQQESHPSVLMQASTCSDVKGRSGGRRVCNSHVLSFQRAACWSAWRKRKEGSDGNLAANGNVLSGLCKSEDLEVLEEQTVTTLVAPKL